MDSHKHLKNDCSEYQDLLHHKNNALSGPSAKGDLGKKRKKKERKPSPGKMNYFTTSKMAMESEANL